MKISKYSLIFLILNIIIHPLLGRYNILGISAINKIIHFTLPLIYFISFIIDVKRNKKIKELCKLNIFTILIPIFILSLILSIIRGIDFNFNVITNLIFYIYLVLFIYTIYFYKFTQKDLINIFKSIILTISIILIIGIIQYIFKFDLIINGIYKYPGSIGRITSLMSISTILDKFLTINLILILYVCSKLKKFNGKLALIAIISVIALALTYSRTGILCFYISSFIFIILFLLKKQYLNIVLVITMLITLYLIPGQKYLLSSTAYNTNIIINEILEKSHLEKLSPINNFVANIFIIDGSNIENDASLNSRELYMKIAKELIKEYPITGIGIGNYNYLFKKQNVNDYLKNDIILTGNYLYPHNQYYQFGSETGLLGLISLISILIAIFIISIKKQNYISIIILPIFLLMCTTESLFYMKDIAIYFIIVYSLLMKEYEKRTE